jgi:hypothetical protein
VTVRVTVSNFKVGVSPASATVMAGQAVSYNVTATSQLGTFPCAITLGCSNLPVLSTCSFSPASLTPGTNAATSTLMLSTTAASSLILPQCTVRPPPTAELTFVVLLLLVLVGGVQTRRRIPCAACGVLFAFLLLQVSCGGGGSSGGSGITVNPGTPAGTYSITITGTSGSLVQSASVNLVVQ